MVIPDFDLALLGDVLSFVFVNSLLGFLVIYFLSPLLFPETPSQPTCEDAYDWDDPDEYCLDSRIILKRNLCIILMASVVWEIYLSARLINFIFSFLFYPRATK